MAAILNTVILNSSLLDSAILHKTLTQTNSIWLKLIHSHSTWRCQPSWILPSWIQPFWTKKTSLIHCHSTWGWQPSWILPSWIQPFCTKKTSLIHSDSTWWSQPSWILPCWIQTLPSWIQTPCYLLSDSLRNTLTPLWLWLKLKSIWLKLIHSYLTWWWQPSWILSSWILPSLIQPFCTKLWLKLIQSDSNSFILTQLEMCSHLEFCHLWFSHFAQNNFTHSFWLYLMVAAILNSAMLDSDTAILDSDTLLSSLRFTQKHSHSTLTLTQTNSI